MKKVSILIPCYNEQENVRPMSEAIVDLFEKQLTQYDYELLFIDNDSSDQTRPILREICKNNEHIKAIFNAKNFGQFNSPYYGMLQTTGDCTISMVCDFQDPVELIPQYLEAWEQGYKIVIGIKTSSKENPIMYHLRSVYYKMIKKFSDVEQIEHFTGSGLYDKDFIQVLRDLKDPTPFLRGIVAELGYKRKEIPYEQPERRAGKTHNNFLRLYDAAMLSFLYKDWLENGNISWNGMWSNQCSNWFDLSYNETCSMGYVCCWNGTCLNWNVFLGFCTTIFPWFYWRICFKY